MIGLLFYRDILNTTYMQNRLKKNRESSEAAVGIIQTGANGHLGQGGICGSDEK